MRLLLLAYSYQLVWLPQRRVGFIRRRVLKVASTAVETSSQILTIARGRYFVELDDISIFVHKREVVTSASFSAWLRLENTSFVVIEVPWLLAWIQCIRLLNTLWRDFCSLDWLSFLTDSFDFHVAQVYKNSFLRIPCVVVSKKNIFDSIRTHTLCLCVVPLHALVQLHHPFGLQDSLQHWLVLKIKTPFSTVLACKVLALCVLIIMAAWAC